jgi:hypothetical protein
VLSSTPRHFQKTQATGGHTPTCVAEHAESIIGGVVGRAKIARQSIYLRPKLAAWIRAHRPIASVLDAPPPPEHTESSVVRSVIAIPC